MYWTAQRLGAYSQAMRLKPNSFVGFTQTLEKKIIPLFRKQKGF